MSKVQVGDKFEVSFPGAGNQAGAVYEVYHVTNQNKNIPSSADDVLVFLKITQRSFFNLGAPFTVCVPQKEIDQFFKFAITRK
jgi:hypothetical protein